MDRLVEIGHVGKYVMARAESITLDIFNATLYCAQKDYLATNGLSLMPDVFVARQGGAVPLLMDYMIKRKEWSSNDGSWYYTLESPDLDYIAPKATECLDKWLDICMTEKTGKEIKEMLKDSAWEKAWESRQDDPELGVISKIAMARAAGASEDMVNQIRERIVTSAMLMGTDPIIQFD